jgi:hypothetical protein
VRIVTKVTTKKACLEPIAYKFSVLICSNAKENPEDAFSSIPKSNLRIREVVRCNKHEDVFE